MGKIQEVEDINLATVRVGPDKTKGRSTAIKNSLLSAQYETIGEGLMIAEAACLRVGVPWLPLVAKRRKLLQLYDAPLSEFIRIQLVTVSTNTLEQYCDDLDTVRPDKESAELLQLDALNPFERYATCLLLFFCLFCICLYGSVLLGSSIQVGVLCSLLTAIPAAGLALFSCQEIQRRASFIALLNKELMRRNGQADSDSQGLLISVKT